MSSAFADRAFRFRTLTQLITLTAFVTMGVVVLALYHYKHQPELGYFLLYLVIMSAWALMVFFFPAIRSGPLQLVLRSFFAFTVLASALLAAGLLGMELPRSGRGLLGLIAGCAVFFLLGMNDYSPLRFGILATGMFFCLYLLMAAVKAGYEGAGLMLLPCAVTTGFRIWALLPGLDSPFFVESVPFYLLRCSRLYDLPFAIGCMVFVCRRFALLFDRTEQLARELDARVAERTKELTAETDARKSMMLNIFHDLRSPLFAVSNGLETLESAPEALPALLPALRQRVEFLRRLTEDLFLAAKLEQKQLLLNEDRAALNEEAAAVCAACQSEADQKGVALCLSADVLLPVWGDSVRLQQILQNLVTNAIHYTPAGGSIHVVCRAEGGTACVSVQDTGCGIAPEDQGAVFDRYFHTSADKKHDSTGLGLTIAQELARLHHGEITLQSEVGRGSIFTLRLPLLNIEEYSSLRFYRKTRN